jgi:hypothetical protein
MTQESKAIIKLTLALRPKRRFCVEELSTIAHMPVAETTRVLLQLQSAGFAALEREDESLYASLSNSRVARYMAMEAFFDAQRRGVSSSLQAR